MIVYRIDQLGAIALALAKLNTRAHKDPRGVGNAGFSLSNLLKRERYSALMTSGPLPFEGSTPALNVCPLFTTSWGLSARGELTQGILKKSFYIPGAHATAIIGWTRPPVVPEWALEIFAGDRRKIP